MGLFKSAGLSLNSLLSLSYSQATSSKASPPTTSTLVPQTTSSFLFPQFVRLPVELRLKIWTFAADSRSLSVHLHSYSPLWIRKELRYDGYASDHHRSQSSPSEPFDGPKYVPETEEEGGVIYSGRPGSQNRRPRHMVITPCTGTYPCKCAYYPPQSFSAVPLPAVFLVSHESREAVKPMYLTRLDGEYDTRGLAVANPVSKIYKARASKPPITGLLLNPSVDAIYFRVNVASRSSVEEIHHFAAITAQQVPDVSKVTVELSIIMQPSRFWSSTRFQYWRRWGEDGWWVPTRFLVQMRGLREVVFLRMLKPKKDKMLPDEWRRRTEALWIEEFLKVKDKWPAEWEGKMPSLKFRQESIQQ